MGNIGLIHNESDQIQTHFIHFPFRPDLMNVSIQIEIQLHLPDAWKCFLKSPGFIKPPARGHLHMFTICIPYLSYQLHIAIWRLCGVCPICSKHMTWLYVSGVSIPTDFLHFWTVWGNSMQTKRAHSNSIQTDENWMCFPLAALCPGWGISIWFYRLLDMISCRRFFTKIVRICSPSHLPDRTLILDISFQVACPMTMFFNVKC